MPAVRRCSPASRFFLRPPRLRVPLNCTASSLDGLRSQTRTHVSSVDVSV
jgi:hypothetical protein